MTAMSFVKYFVTKLYLAKWPNGHNGGALGDTLRNGRTAITGCPWGYIRKGAVAVQNEGCRQACKHTELIQNIRSCIYGRTGDAVKCIRKIP